MVKITLANCKAPAFSEFPKLAKIKADAVFEEVRTLKHQIAELDAKLAKLQPRIQAKLEAGLDPDVKSVLYEDLLVTRRDGYTRRSLDTKWAVKKLIAKGVRKEEIDDHTNETVIEAGISMQLLGDGDEGEGGR